MENITASVALATQTLLTKLIVEMRKSGALTDSQIDSAITAGRKVLESDGDEIGIRAGLYLESLHEDLQPDAVEAQEAAKPVDQVGRALTSLSSWAERLEGQAYADRVIQDALVVTVLQSAPQLREALIRNLQIRYDHMPSGMRGDPLKWFQRRMEEMRKVIDSQAPKP
ncbi:hypothetical protein PMI14_05835 [Acidovorax sp. CF316]|uniref:hypothetical protein n=1 Tax=Acidovorax sp. CF316 TaxID=1144317 RepID=UPI00026BC7FB|nr:hypothetical protein [Acidovorax sp. CF316]EJE49592.1 hypothetical protein PMI14_05835 [Acidovorax sp. CF316]